MRPLGAPAALLGPVVQVLWGTGFSTSSHSLTCVRLGTGLQFVRETYGTEEELQEQAVEWLEQQDLREFQREYEEELAAAAVQFGEAEVRASGAGLCQQQHGRESLREFSEVHSFGRASGVRAFAGSSSSVWTTPSAHSQIWRAAKRFIEVLSCHSCLLEKREEDDPPACLTDCYVTLMSWSVVVGLQDEFEEKANPAAYAFGDGEVEDNFEISKLTEEELAETEQAEAAQVRCWLLRIGHWVRVSVIVRAKAPMLKPAGCAQRLLVWPMGPSSASAIAPVPALAEEASPVPVPSLLASLQCTACACHTCMSHAGGGKT